MYLPLRGNIVQTLTSLNVYLHILLSIHPSPFVWIQTRETLHSFRHYDVSHSGRGPTRSAMLLLSILTAW
ncbi:hypothetical protein ARMGADRAFT_699239 [Armillaria gallica]|uniref:Uncharacterized protein n=1 Tax=Armillaria gallica TaxID=47427 RepID=A0A2H3E7G2_ARMGA|nr:hypothetical protein ARMGADRAFT_699239 [Armillaria gallica]